MGVVAPATTWGDPILERARRQMQEGKPADAVPREDRPAEDRQGSHPRPASTVARSTPTEEQQRRDQARYEQIQRTIARALVEAERLLDADRHVEAYPILQECRTRLGKFTDPTTQA
jgi:hypothetical protein